MRYQTRALLQNLQPTADTDPGLVGGDAIFTTDLDWTYYDGPTVTEEQDKAFMGADPQQNTNPQSTFSFNSRFVGSGTAGTASRLSSTLRACGLSETVNAGTDVVYQPVSTGFESVASYFLRTDGLLQRTLNCKGSMGFTWAAGQLVQFNFTNFIGSYTRPEAPPTTPAIVPDTSGWPSAPVVSKANTPTFVIDGYTACVASFTMAMNNTVVADDIINCSSVDITERSVSGEILIEAPTIGAKNFFEKVESHVNINTVVLQGIHGTTAGLISQIDMPAIQLGTPAETDRNGKLFYTFPYTALPVNGDDEFVLTQR